MCVCVSTVLYEALTPDDEVSDGGRRQVFWHVADGVESCMWRLHVTNEVGNRVRDVLFGHRVCERRVCVNHIFVGL